MSQFLVEGGGADAACCPIAIAAVVTLGVYPKFEDFREPNWDAVLDHGRRLHLVWQSKHRGRVKKDGRFCTFHEILKTSPRIEEKLNKYLKIVDEIGGVLLLFDKRADGRNYFTLEQMFEKVVCSPDSPCFIILTIGIYTLLIWCTVEGFALIDSHGIVSENETTTIGFCADYGIMCGEIRRICEMVKKNTQVSVGTEDATGTFSAVILKRLKLSDRTEE